MPVIDVHTHMLNKEWLALLRRHGKPRYEVKKSLDAAEGIFLDGAPFMTPQPGRSDYPHNIGDMKGCLARVDALPASERTAVRGGNAARIFRL